MTSPQVIITSGEPAGIGPDIIIALAQTGLNAAVLGDADLFRARAKQLNLAIELIDYQSGTLTKPGQIALIPCSCPKPVIAGQLNPANAGYVIDMLTLASSACLNGQFDAMVTAPVNKAVINQAGIVFSGHTEFLATACQADEVMMLLACETMRVALITTHIPLKDVPGSITQSLLSDKLTLLQRELSAKFGLESPQLYVTGLNPHAGESGCLGSEEIDIIAPAIEQLSASGMDVFGPYPADTLFTPPFCHKADAFVAMYHDQGLAVLKYAGFHQAANITLGLPIIRTSVDHGTALEIAGSGTATPSSLLYAINMATQMTRRVQND